MTPARVHRTVFTAFQVTTVDRTLVDVAGSDISQEVRNGAVADAVGRGETTRRRLLRRSSEAAARVALRLERAVAAQEGS